MTISVAIIGSGPAGCYTADALLKSDVDVQIDVIDRLPTPFGLIRAGVAPDHQTTKKIQKKFGTTLADPSVRYFGNVVVGRAISLAELRDMYDAVVLAVGAPYDHKLGISGEDKTGVYGSASFVGWYNAHPDLRDLNPALDTKAVAVIGVGNVAIDVARVLVKDEAEMADSDLPAYAAKAIQNSPITDVYIIGRRGPIEAKFTNVELREMGKLEHCVSLVDADQLPDDVGDVDLSDRDKRLKERNLNTLKEFADSKPNDKPKRVHFVFYASPVEILGGDKVEGLKLERTKIEEGRAVGTGEFFEIDCGLVIPAIGYRATPVEGAPFDERRCVVPNDDGRVDDRLYAVGWIKRGPTGVIATNRPDGEIAAKHILEDVQSGEKPGRSALKKLLAKKSIQVVDIAGWQKIEKIENESAKPPAPRLKFETVDDMLAAVNGS
jgi:NADPH-dependent glutamate synthase beta subunit-like oxidoreductase